MIGYFLKGDRDGITKIRSVLETAHGIATLTREKVRDRRFGVDLNLILVEIIAESDLLIRFRPEMRVGGFRKGEKSTGVKIPITKEMLQLPRAELRSRIVQATCDSIDLVRKKFGKKLDTDFDGLKAAFLDAVSLPQDFDWSKEPEAKSFWDK